MSSNLKKKPDLSFATLWNLSFGFFGVQIATHCRAPTSAEFSQRWGPTLTILATFGYCLRLWASSCSL